ncbi:VTT domain-containing protein [Microbacterium sp. STN6]|uniref:DedA family protein n=1 Tax=Microbacterium sp. STN6 TaxID=2995588 RepID=UPI002260A4E3|nr:VTT domain-containing protein [Microbacterium sp. STN6]MCX7521771.1 VTT domain-containing protein [Microbacterium sp. STN6]
MDPISELVMQTMSSPWVYPVLFALVVIDGFFPPVPSETVVVAAAAVGVSAGLPNPWLVVAIAAVGAAVGDNIAYSIGRAIGIDRFAWMRRPRIAAAVHRAGHGLERRAAVVILTARYIPIGRIAVNMTAGATGFAWRRFWPLTLLGGITWAGYSVLIGTAAGHWAHKQPLAAALVGIVVAVACGIIIDFASTRVRRHHERRQARETQEHESEHKTPGRSKARLRQE